MRFFITISMFIYLVISMFFMAFMFGGGSQSNDYLMYCENDKSFYRAKTRVFALSYNFFTPARLMSCYLLKDVK